MELFEDLLSYLRGRRKNSANGSSAQTTFQQLILGLAGCTASVGVSVAFCQTRLLHQPSSGQSQKNEAKVLARTSFELINSEQVAERANLVHKDSTN